MKEIYIDQYIYNIEQEVNRISGTDEEMKEQLLKFAARIISDLKEMFTYETR